MLYSNFSVAKQSMAMQSVVKEDFYIKENNPFKDSSVLSFGYKSLSADGAIKNTRFEQEFAYSNFTYAENLLDKTEVTSNLYYDMQNYQNFTPYLGVSAVITSLSGSDDKYYNDTLTKYNLMAGVSYKPQIAHIFAVNMKYNYSDKLEDSYNKENVFNHQSGYINNTDHSILAYIDVSF